VWAEAINHTGLRSVVQRGADQRRLLTGFLQRAKEVGALTPEADPEAITRVYLALFQGFVLQQSWDPGVDVDPYLDTVHNVIDATVSTTQGAPHEQV
jgi:hypothetical protein